MRKSFKDYMSHKDKQKVEISPSGDTAPTGDNSPSTAATKGKNWEAQVKPAGKPAPYATTEKPVPQEWPHKYEKGLGNKGSIPDCCKAKQGEPQKEGGKKVATWPKTTEEFLQQTKGMSLPEFTAFVSDQGQMPELTDLPISNNPIMATRYVAALANINDKIIETLVWELRRVGCFDKLVKEVAKHHTYHEETDDPASETEVGEEKPKKAKPTKSIGTTDNQMDLAGGAANIETTKAGKMKKK